MCFWTTQVKWKNDFADNQLCVCDVSPDESSNILFGDWATILRGYNTEGNPSMCPVKI